MMPSRLATRCTFPTSGSYQPTTVTSSPLVRIRPKPARQEAVSPTTSRETTGSRV
jgi:hypothetical protein